MQALSKFNAYRGLGNSCPVCTSTSGKCSWQPYELPAKKDGGIALNTTKTFCLKGAGGYGNPDYHYFGDTRDGTWGIYVPLVDWSEYVGSNTQVTPEERERWIQEQQEKQAALLAAENHRRAESLPPTERNPAARAILSQLSIAEIDRQDLLQRGFTSHQIRTIGFKSVEKWQRLKEPVNNRFPGVNISGTKLNNGIAGILIPLYTVTGEIVGCQIRNRERVAKGRYRWLSSTWEKGRDNGAAPALPNGENPLTFVYPQLLEEGGKGERGKGKGGEIGERGKGKGEGENLSSVASGLNQPAAETAAVVALNSNELSPLGNTAIDASHPLPFPLSCLAFRVGEPDGREPLPLSPFPSPTAKTRYPIGLAEGTGAKPHLAAIKTGQQVIGAAGGQWLSSPELLKDGLERWRADEIDLYLDGDDLQKPQVIRRWLKLYHQLTEWSYRPRLLHSGTDIDELEDLSQLRELSVADLERCLTNTTPQPTVISLARQLYYKSKRFTPNQTQNSRYLHYGIPDTFSNTLIAIKSALGTGKTEILKSLAATARERGLELIFIGYRNNLLRQTCDRLPDLYHVVDEDRILLDSDYHKALCHHSAGLLAPDGMTNKIVVLDECVSVLVDMLTSKLTAGRCKDGRDSRQVRLAHIKELLENCHGIVALDAYLSDTEVDFLRGLKSFDFIHKVENTYQNQATVRFVAHKSTLTRAILDDALAGANLLVTATTQNHCENLEKALTRIGIPANKICRIDSKTDRDDRIGLFFRNPKAYLETYRPQIVILSPTAESGISIDLPGYFQTHYHFHLGNLGILSGLQFLGRYRDFSAPRVIYCAERGQIDGSNPSSFTNRVKDEFDRRVRTDIDLVFSLLDAGRADEAMQLLTACAQTEDPWLKLAHQYRANLNEEMKYLKELFVAAMVRDGYLVSIDTDAEDCEDTSELMGKVETERRVIQSRRLYAAPDIDKLQYETIRNNPCANELDRLLASKYYLTQIQLPGIMETDSYSAELIQMVKYNHPALVKQLETYYYLLNPELAEIDHLAVWLPVLETESTWLPDQLQRSSLSLVNVGRELGIDRFLGERGKGKADAIALRSPQRALHPLSPFPSHHSQISKLQIEEICDRVAGSQLYQSALSLRINPNKQPNPIKICRRILKKFGLKLVKLKDELFGVLPMAETILSFSHTPKYELLTPELCDRVRELAGREFRTDDLEIQALGAAMEALGMHDGRGKMRLVAGSARHLGMSVTTHRHRAIDAKGEKKPLRIYKFELGAEPISGAIRDTQLYPNTQPILVKHVYECVTRRLEKLASYQQEKVVRWQEARTPSIEQLSVAIQIDNLASNDEIKQPIALLGSPELSQENLQSVAQTLLQIGLMKGAEFKMAVDEYLSVMNREVVRFALELLRSEHSGVVERFDLG